VNDAQGFRELRRFSRQWRPRTWAIECCNGNNDTDAHSIALVGLHTPDLPEVHADDRRTALRLLSNRRRELVGQRTQCVNRLHRDLVGLVAGGAPRALTAKKARALLASMRPRDEIGRLRRQLAAELLAELVTLDKKVSAIEAEVRALVRSTPTGLTKIYGVGPVITALTLGEFGDVARSADRHHFASYNGTAPDDKGSAGSPAHCVNIKGNRKLNHAIHMIAITQIRNRKSPGRAYYDRKLAQSKTKKEALRALKRRISDVPYRQLATRSGPGRANGDDSHSQRDRPNPDGRHFGQATARTQPKLYAHRQHRLTEGCQYAPRGRDAEVHGDHVRPSCCHHRVRDGVWVGKGRCSAADALPVA
jgi:transposase